MTASVLKNSHHKRWLINILLLVALAAILFGLTQKATAPITSSKPLITDLAILGKHVFSLEVADTPAAREQGLSGRSSLGNNDGMLFVFQQPATACFWMKDMHFNLDILWFDSDNQLIYQQQNLAPATYPNSFCPSQLAKSVVEVNAGVSKQLDLKLGDQLMLQKQ